MSREHICVKKLYVILEIKSFFDLMNWTFNIDWSNQYLNLFSEIQPLEIWNWWNKAIIQIWITSQNGKHSNPWSKSSAGYYSMNYRVWPAPYPWNRIANCIFRLSPFLSNQIHTTAKKNTFDRFAWNSVHKRNLASSTISFRSRLLQVAT